MEQLQLQNAVQDARQLFRITRIECGLPLERVRALVLGDVPCAALLAQELIEAGALVDCMMMPPSVPACYDLVLLFCPLGAEDLSALTLPDALVVDACRAQNSEWVIYDPTLHYRRIRVISMVGV